MLFREINDGIKQLIIIKKVKSKNEQNVINIFLL